MQPKIQILIVGNTRNGLRNLIENFNKVKRGVERANNISIEFVGTLGVDETLGYMESGIVPEGQKTLKAEYGDIQAVIVHWDVNENSKLLQRIGQIRSEIHTFVITTHYDTYNLYNPELRNVHFIQKEDVDDDHLLELQRIINTFNDRRRTPFWTAYREYVEEANYTWHTPGHAGGSSFKNSPYLNGFYEFFGSNMFLGDLSASVEHLGSLLDSTGYVGEAEAKAAKTFNVRQTYFVTNGSSTSNKIILQTVLRPGDKAIIDRNCHKSVHYGMVNVQAAPVYINSPFSGKYGIFAPPSLKDIRQALQNNPDAKLLVLTGCTYDGLLIPVRKVVEMVREVNRKNGSNIKVFIDEAWFAYASFHPYFKEYSAVLSGADYVTHSAHKVLSAFSQSSYIHVNDPDFDEDYFREIFYLYTSTSPQYHIIASLGVCSVQMEVEGFKLISKALQQAQRFRDAISSRLQKIKVIEMSDFVKEFPEMKNYGHDPLKVLLDVSALHWDVKTIQSYLQTKGFEVEKTTHEGTILILFTIGTSMSKEGELFFALSEIENESGRLAPKTTKKRREMDSIIPPVETAGLNYFFKEKIEIKIDKAEGKISSFFVTPYPPGIPILAPGQTITKEHIEYLEQQIKDNRSIQGCRNGKIFVVKS